MATLATIKQWLTDRHWDDASTRGVRILESCINDAMQAIAAKARMPYHLVTDRLLLVAPYVTGTVAVANGGTTVTITTGTIPAAAAGQYMILGNVAYKIATVAGGGGTCTLEEAYQGTTIVSQATNILFHSISLPTDFREFVGGAHEFNRNGLYYIPLIEWLRLLRSSPATTQDYPDNYALDYNKMFVYPAPASGKTVEFQYYKKPAIMTADNDVVLLPDEWLPLLRTCSLHLANAARDKSIVNVWNLVDGEIRAWCDRNRIDSSPKQIGMYEAAYDASGSARGTVIALNPTVVSLPDA